MLIMKASSYYPVYRNRASSLARSKPVETEELKSLLVTG
jgi:hypothetical protein